MKFRNWASMVLALMAFIAIFAPTSSANDVGQCNGPDGDVITSPEGWLINLRQDGVTKQAAEVARSMGFSPINSSFEHFVRTRTVIAKLAKPATIQNYGCRDGALFDAGMKSLARGTSVLVALPLQFALSDVRTKPTPGFKPIDVRAKFGAQTSCSNPGKGWVVVTLWVRQPQVPLRLVKIAKDGQGNLLEVPEGIFKFRVCTQRSLLNGHFDTKRCRVVGNTAEWTDLGKVSAGSRISACELPPPPGWQAVTKAGKPQRCLPSVVAKAGKRPLQLTFYNVIKPQLCVDCLAARPVYAGATAKLGLLACGFGDPLTAEMVSITPSSGTVENIKIIELPDGNSMIVFSFTPAGPGTVEMDVTISGPFGVTIEETVEVSVLR